jgi:spore coat protein U-like protein
VPSVPGCILIGRLILFGLVVAGLASAAQAQTCTFTFSAVSFGNVDVTSGGAYDTTGTFQASCSGWASLSTVRICPHLGPGSGGAGANGSPRTMLKDGTGPDSLNYNLYKDAGRTSVWGSYLAGWSGATPPQIDLTVNALGSGTSSTSVYGRVAGSQNTAAVGSYSSNFSGSDVRVRYEAAGANDCSTITANEGTTSFTTSATLPASCTVNAQTLDFGTVGLLATNRDAQSDLSIVCTRSAAYKIALGPGQNAGGLGVNARKMKSGAVTIAYQLYQDASHSVVWGDTLTGGGTNVKSDTGTGLTQTHTVYGRVPPQTTPAAGTYGDTVVVTVEY